MSFGIKGMRGIKTPSYLYFPFKIVAFTWSHWQCLSKWKNLPIESSHHQTGYSWKLIRKSCIICGLMHPKIFVWHLAFIPNDKFALLQPFGRRIIPWKVASLSFSRLHVQRQLDCWMSCLTAFQQRSCMLQKLLKKMYKCKSNFPYNRIQAKINDICIHVTLQPECSCSWSN